MTLNLFLAVALSAAVCLMPRALHARQWRPNSPSERTSDRHVNMSGFFKHLFPSGEEEAELDVVPDWVSLGASPQ